MRELMCMRIRLLFVAAVFAVPLFATSSAAQEPASNPRVFVIGIVKHPGEYPYTNGMTVRTALDLAGGVMAHADTKAIQVVRIEANGRVTRYPATDETSLLPGDQIFVPTRGVDR